MPAPSGHRTAYCENTQVCYPSSRVGLDATATLFISGAISGMKRRTSELAEAMIVNLNKYRKQRERAEADRRAAENRARFGRSKEAREQDRRERERAEKSIDDKKLD